MIQTTSLLNQQSQQQPLARPAYLPSGQTIQVKLDFKVNG